jgi:hypothetical protein
MIERTADRSAAPAGGRTRRTVSERERREDKHREYILALADRRLIERLAGARAD